MRFVLTLRYVLPLLAVIGLLVAPIVRSAMPAMHSEAAAATAEGVMAAMPEGMPCCPDEAPASDCAKTCPLLAICMSPCIQSFAATGLLVPYRLAGLVAPDSDSSLERLGQPPPGKPPKA